MTAGELETPIEPCPGCGKPMRDGTCSDCFKSPDELSARTVLPDRTQPGALAQAPEPAPDPGAVSAASGVHRIAGYRILRELGTGGMGSVYEAFDEKMQRNVALKVLARHLAPSEEAGRRFEHEAWIAGKLDHPNLVKVYERGTWEDLSYFSMELVDGGSLAEVIDRLTATGRDETLGLEFGTREYVLWAVTQVIAAARGLDFAHRHHVIHRDVKPLNILLSREPKTVKIVDFGLAVDTDRTRMTAEGAVLGTVIYMAPEQLLGRPDEVGVRTDVYGLGVTLFELLTLERPFEARSQELYASAVLTGATRRPSKINARIGGDLETVICKCLEKAPKDRYASAAELADDLERVLDFQPIHARSSGYLERSIKWARRKPMHAALLLLLLTGVPTVAVLGQRSLQHRRLVREARIEQLWDEANYLVTQRRDYSSGIERVDAILRIDPDHVRALRTRAISSVFLVLDDRSRIDAAALELRALEDLARIERLLPERAWPYRLTGFLLGKLGHDAEAAQAEALAAQRDTADPDDDDLYFDALRAYDTADYAQVVDLLSRLIVRSPNRPAAFGRRALAQEALGQPRRALLDFSVAAALNPRDPFTYLGLGRVLNDLGSLDEARQYLERAGELDPDSVYVYETLSHNHHLAGVRAVGANATEEALRQFAAAESSARRALEVDPDWAMAHLNLGLSLIEQIRLGTPDPARFEQALAHYERAREIWSAAGSRSAGGYSLVLINMCDALIETGEIERATPICVEVTQIRPEDPNAFYNLAGLHALSGRADEAFQALERDFELGDHDFGYLLADRWFEGLRDDPRFDDLIRRMKRAADEAG